MKRKKNIITLAKSIYLFFLFSVIGFIAFNALKYLNKEAGYFLLSKPSFFKYVVMIHLLGALIAILSGAYQWILYNSKRHRLLGYIYVYTVLFALIPSSFVMLLFIKGGWLLQCNFLVLNLLLFVMTYQGVVTAQKKKFKVHRKWMLRSFVLMQSAVYLRLFSWLFHFFQDDTALNYLLASVASWSIPLLILEYSFYFFRNRNIG